MSLTKQPTVHRHPMFRAMVVMGNGLTVGCGGVATSERAHADNGNGNGKDAGSSGSSSSSTGGISGSGGGSFIVGTGGTNIIAGTGGEPVIMGAGGTMTIGTGGAAAAPPPCPAAQYDCSALNLDCGVNGGGWSLGNCSCDAKRPRSAADCAAGLVFVCRRGTSTADGHVLPSVVPFECSCIPAPQGCGAGCDTAFGIGQMSCEEPTASSILCGCAYVVLR